MALTDYMEGKVEVTDKWKGVPFQLPQQSTLAAVDSDMEQAQKSAQLRSRREEIQNKITNLENQNTELRARLKELKSVSLSDMDEDKIVAMAKAKGIKNEDIDAWLRGRAQRSARMISEGQRKELEKQADELKEQNKAQDVQAIYDADQEYEEVFEKTRLSQDETAASMDKKVLAKKNKLDTLKAQFKRRYGESWESYTGEGVEDKKREAKPKAEGVEAEIEEKEEIETPAGAVVLTEEEKSVLDETTMQKFNERDTTNKERRAIKASAQKKVRQKAEAKRAREKELAGIKGHLKTLGITKESNIRKALKDAEKTTDKTVRRALDDVLKFLETDKEFKIYSDLKKLL